MKPTNVLDEHRAAQAEALARAGADEQAILDLAAASAAHSKREHSLLNATSVGV